MTRPDAPFELIRRALAHVAADQAVWRRVCVPIFGEPPLPAAELPADVVAGLVAGGVVRAGGGLLHRRRWVTLMHGRPYFPTLDDHGRERGFVQDVWPETHALLDRIRLAPPGRLADVGTGCGVLAIEAALAGHQVVATDIDAGALATAAWNAALHGVTLDLRRGHMTVPLGDDLFDVVASAPHYGAHSDMLRLEVLRDGPARLAPGGTLLLGTFLEWDGDGIGVVESVLRPLAERGARVSVTPIRPRVKARWFTTPSPAAPGMVARGRFLVELRPAGPPALDSALPALEPEVVVPLARLAGERARRPEARALLDERTSGAWNRRPLADIGDGDDLAALEELLDDCARGVLDLEAPVPFALHDDCRFGGAPCVEAHGAIVDARGGVRPCSRGEVVGRVSDGDAEVHGRMLALRAALEERRGCARCPAQAVCSKCAFPAVMDETAYCDLVRRHAAALPILPRVLKLLSYRHAGAVASRHLRLRFGVAAGPDEEPLPLLREGLRRASLAVVDDDEAAVAPDDPDEPPFALAPALAPIVERVMDGAGRDELRAFAAERGLAPQDFEPLLYLLAQWLR